MSGTIKLTATILVAVGILAFAAAGCSTKDDVNQNNLGDKDVDKPEAEENVIEYEWNGDWEPMPETDNPMDNPTDNPTDQENTGGLTIYDVQNPESPNHPAADSTVELKGVIVTSGTFKASSNLTGFFVSDATTGKWHGIEVVYGPSVTVTGMTIGSVVDIAGKYVEYNDFSEINATSITVVSQGIPLEPVVIDDPAAIATGGADAEAYESVLVEVRNVSVIDNSIGYGQFKVTGGLMVDDAIYKYTPVPANGTVYARLAGFLTYSFSNFMLVPRDANDMVIGGAADGDDETADNATDNPVDNPADEVIDNATDNPVDNPTDEVIDNATDNPVDNPTDNVSDIDGQTGLTIYDVQNPASPNHPAVNSNIELKNVIVMSDVFQASSNLKGLFVSDMNVGPWRGIMLAFPSTVDVTGVVRGSVVDVAGQYIEYNDLSEIKATSITKTGATQQVVSYAVDDPSKLATGSAEAESFEGVLVTVYNVTVLDNSIGYGEFKVTGNLLVDDMLYKYTPLPANGTVYNSLTGFMNYSFSNFMLEPRDANDMAVGSVPDGDVEITEEIAEEIAEEVADEPAEEIEEEVMDEPAEEIEEETPSELEEIPANLPKLVINEVDYDQYNTDSAEFIEILNVGTEAADLTGISVFLVNGNASPGSSYKEIPLSGTLPAGGYLLIADSGYTAPGTCALTFQLGASDQIQNGSSDAIVIIDTASKTIIDTVTYEGCLTSATLGSLGAGFNVCEGTGITTASQYDDNVDGNSINRCANGTDTNDNGADFKKSSTVTPCAANVCP